MGVIRERVVANKNRLTSSFSKKLHFPRPHYKEMQGQCFQIYPVQSGGRMRGKELCTLDIHSERQTNVKVFPLPFSRAQKTKSPLIESRENQGNKQYVSNDITQFFLIQSQMIYLMPSVDSRQTESVVRKGSKWGKSNGWGERERERERRANLCIHMFISDLSSRKLVPAFCW